MSEIKNNFLKGRMNKDLDERLIPKGEYRDANNVEVSTSEGSDVGSLQNILGNHRVDDSISQVSNDPFKCVGSINDEKSNRLFWLVTSKTVDAIVEWDDLIQKSTLIFVDINKRNSGAALKFPNKKITGINIIDDFLFFTDGISEPKKINIADCRLGTTDLNTQTRFFVNGVDKGDIREEHITVIKKRPNRPPTFKINHSNDIKEKGIFEKTFPRFSYRYKYSDGEYSAFGPFTTPVFSAKHSKDFDSKSFYSKKEGYNTSMLNTIESVEITDFVPQDIPRGVVQVDLLFKREDSNVVYTVASVRENDEEFTLFGSGLDSGAPDTNILDRGRYLVTTENIYSALPENQLLRSWDNVPKSALAQEVTGSRIVYGNYKQGYDVGNQTVKLESNYETRSLFNYEADGFPTIKAQRNYQIGVVYGDKYGRETPVLTSNDASVLLPWDGNNVGDGPNYLSSLILNSSIQTAIPSWVDYYKFYVKQTSGEYYNLLLNKVYIPSTSSEFVNEDDHIWLAFPSSDINKIQVDDYLILKKVSSSSERHIEDKNRYKIIDIKAEAPDSVAYVYLSLAELSNENDNEILANGSSESGLFTDFSKRIDNTVDSLVLSKTAIDQAGFPPINLIETGFMPATNFYISWKETAANGTQTFSKRYKIVSVEPANSGSFSVKLSEKISKQDAQLAASATVNYDESISNADTLNPDLSVLIQRKELKDGEDFSGKFFVKILSDEIIENNLTSIKSNPSLNKFVSSTNKTFWWADAESIYGDDGVESGYTLSNNPNTQPIANNDSQTGSTNTQAEWETLYTDFDKAMFIDNMYMVAANLSESNYAKNSGQGMVSNEVSYSKIEWDVDEDNSWFMEGDSSWPLSNLNVGGEWPEKVRNAMPGLINVNSESIDGAGSWKKDIYSQEKDDVYGTEEDACYLHLSFFAPGKDLHDGSFEGGNDLANIDVFGENSIAKLLKGIWGGGVFTSQNGEEIESTVEGLANAKFIEFESNYIDDEALIEAPGPGIGKGYDLNFKEQHERQWDPTYSPTKVGLEDPVDNDLELEEFVSNINAGAKFKFEDSDELYTILSVDIKHIYNHTPWRARYEWRDTPFVGAHLAGDSVEEAAVAWAEAKLTNAADLEDLANALCNKIQDFGRANNRRTCYILKLDKNPSNSSVYNPIDGGSSNIDIDTSKKIQFINSKAQAESGLVRDVAGIFETEPKDSLDLNIFHEAGQAIPVFIDSIEKANSFAPIGCRVEMFHLPEARRGELIITDDIFLTNWAETDDGRILFECEGINSINDALGFNQKNSAGVDIDYLGARVRFYRPDGSYTTITLLANDDDFLADNGFRRSFVINKIVDETLPMGINWFNCFTFKNGVESNRIEDNFNQPFISNGPRVSTVIEEPYAFEEHRKYGLIYSGIYNASSGINNLNQFIQAEKITKDVNPTYGSIQKLFSRRTDLIAFCEDRVLKILANKDAIFNADGNSQLISNESVLGQTVPFVGEYGIAKNPESFASESYRAYFTDKQRGAVLRLSMDGLTPISEAGMHDWFRDNLPNSGVLLGSYDDYKKQYNITLKGYVFQNVIQNSYITEGEELNQSTSTFQILQGSELNSGLEFNEANINNSYLSGGDNTPIANPNLAMSVEAIDWPGIDRDDVETYTGNQIVQPGTFTWEVFDIVYQDVLGNIQDGSTPTNVDSQGNILTDEVTQTFTTPGDPGTYPTYSSTTVGFQEQQYAPNDPFNLLANGYIEHSDVSHDGNISLFWGTNEYSIAGKVAYDDGYNQFGNGPQIRNAIVWGRIPTLGFSGLTQLEDYGGFGGDYVIYNPGGSNTVENNYPSAMNGYSPNNLDVFYGDVVVVQVTYRVGKHSFFSGFGFDDLPDVKMKVRLLDGAYADDEGNNGNFASDWTAATNIPGYSVYFDSSTNSPPTQLSDPLGDMAGTTWTGSSDAFFPSASTGIDSQFEEYISDEVNGTNPAVRAGWGYFQGDGNNEAEWSVLGQGPHSYGSFFTQEMALGGIDASSDGIWTEDIKVSIPFRIVKSVGSLAGAEEKIIDNLKVKLSVEGVGGSIATTAVRVSRILVQKYRTMASPFELGTESTTETITTNVSQLPVYGYIEGVVGQTQTGTSSFDVITNTDENFGETYTLAGVNAYGNPSQIIQLVGSTDPIYNEVNYLASDPNYDENYGTNGGIPPWTEWRYSIAGVSLSGSTPEILPSVYQAAFDSGSFSSLNGISLQSAYAEAGFPDANPGQWVDIPIEVGGGQYYTGSNANTSNTSNTLSFLPAPSTYDSFAISTIDGVSLPAINDGAVKHVLNNYEQFITLKSNGASSTFVNFSLTSPLIHGNWYVVDLKVTEGDGLGQVNSYIDPEVSSNTFARANDFRISLYGVLNEGLAATAYAASHLQPGGVYPNGSFGQVYRYPTDGFTESGDASGSMVFMPADNTEYGSGGSVLRVVFQADENAAQGLDSIRIQVQGVDNPLAIHVESVNIVDVTETGSGGGFNEHWQASNPSVGQLINSFSEPIHYYQNGGWVWSVYPQEESQVDTYHPNDYTISQVFTAGELSGPSDDGYILEFDIDPHPELNDIEGNLSILLTSPVQSDGDRRYLYMPNVNTAGEYKILFNYEGTDSAEIISQPPGSNVSLFFGTEPITNNPTYNMIPFSADGPNILIRPFLPDNTNGVGGFYGKLNYFKIFNQTTVISGGSSSGWVFSQPQEDGDIIMLTSEDYVSFEDESIVLDQAPNLTQVSQGVDANVTEGEVYNVYFELTHSSGNIEVYYIYQQLTDSTALGFRAWLFPELDEDGEVVLYSLDSDINAGAQVGPTQDEIEGSYGNIAFDEDLTIQVISYNPNIDTVGSLVLRGLSSDEESLDIQIGLDNVTMTQVYISSIPERTLSFSEEVKGWVSFKDFIPEDALSLSKKYFTFNRGKLYQHYHLSSSANNFYGRGFESSVTVIFNDAPDVVKSFNTLFYEGSQSQVIGNEGQASIANDYNLESKDGWRVYSISTDLEKGSLKEFIKKENKWFNYIRGGNNATIMDFSMVPGLLVNEPYSSNILSSSVSTQAVTFADVGNAAGSIIDYDKLNVQGVGFLAGNWEIVVSEEELEDLGL